MTQSMSFAQDKKGCLTPNHIWVGFLILVTLTLLTLLVMQIIEISESKKRCKEAGYDGVKYILTETRECYKNDPLTQEQKIARGIK